MSKAKPQEPDDARASRIDVKTLFYRKLAETHLYFEVGKIIASELEPSDLVQRIMDVIGNSVPFQNACLFLVRKDLTGLEPFYSTGPLFKGVQLEPILLDDGAPGAMAATGEPLFLNDVSNYDGFLHFPQEREKRGSFIGIVLTSDARVLGTMGFSHTDTGAFRVEDFDLLRILSPLISAGLEKAELFRKTLELSRTDELTGLFNYRVMREKLDEEMRRSARSGRDFSFVMIDIDDFKKVNDRFGHLEGSKLIAQLGPVLRSACRAGSLDTCFRYGGEEFSVLMPETVLDDAVKVAERIRLAIEEFPFTLKSAHPTEKVTVSIGVSSRESRSAKSTTDLIHEADVALYRSKAAGKNRVTVFRPGDVMPGDANR